MVECAERTYDARNVKRNEDVVGPKEVEVWVEVQVPGVRSCRHHLHPVDYRI